MPELLFFFPFFSILPVLSILFALFRLYSYIYSSSLSFLPLFLWSLSLSLLASLPLPSRSTLLLGIIEYDVDSYITVSTNSL